MFGTLLKGEERADNGREEKVVKEEFPSATGSKLSLVYKSIYTVRGKASYERDWPRKEKLLSLFKKYILFTKFSSYAVEICKEF